MNKKITKDIKTPSIKDALNGVFIKDSQPVIPKENKKNISYSDSIQDPRWQKKRLEIFRRDNWRCRCCNDTNKPLNAHHLYYIKNRKIWEYEDEVIVTVCNDCHNILHNELPKLSGIIAFNILTGKIDPLNYGKR